MATNKEQVNPENRSPATRTARIYARPERPGGGLSILVIVFVIIAVAALLLHFVFHVF